MFEKIANVLAAVILAACVVASFIGLVIVLIVQARR